MNILFISLCGYESIYIKDIYTDLLREFIKHGDNVFMVCPFSKSRSKKSMIIKENNATILKLTTGDILNQNNVFLKGISIVLVEEKIKNGIKKYFNDVKFDLILYATPPITLVKPIKYIKKRDNAKSYLLLKDIFPQNAVDIGMMQKHGIPGIIYWLFRQKERRIYRISDRIGCMSAANANYVIQHNPEIDKRKVEVCPNSLEIVDNSVDEITQQHIRGKYKLPFGKKIFVYGGNLGKPQGIPFLIDCLRESQDIENAYFLIAGDGTEYELLENFIKREKPHNVKLMRRLPKEEYDTLVASCDVGLIFLDHRFTIPNYPSRLLSYMQAKLPVLACTDPNTDIGKTIVEGKFGWWCESNNLKGFVDNIRYIASHDISEYGCNSIQYFSSHFNVEENYKTIMNGLFQQ